MEAELDIALYMWQLTHYIPYMVCDWADDGGGEGEMWVGCWGACFRKREKGFLQVGFVCVFKAGVRLLIACAGQHTAILTLNYSEKRIHYKTNRRVATWTRFSPKLTDLFGNQVKLISSRWCYANTALVLILLPVMLWMETQTAARPFALPGVLFQG